MLNENQWCLVLKEWSDLLFVILPADVVGVLVAHTMYLTFWHHQQFEGWDDKSSKSPRYYQGEKEWWGKKRYLLTVFAAGNPRDKCKNQKHRLEEERLSGFTLFLQNIIKEIGHKNSTAHRCKNEREEEKRPTLLVGWWRNTLTRITKYANLQTYSHQQQQARGKTCQTLFKNNFLLCKRHTWRLNRAWLSGYETTYLLW